MANNDLFISDITSQAKLYGDLVQTGFTDIETVSAQITSLEQYAQQVMNIQGTGWIPVVLGLGIPYLWRSNQSARARVEAGNLSNELKTMTESLDKNTFYYGLYAMLGQQISATSGTQNAITSVEDALAWLNPPSTMTEMELRDARDTISKILGLFEVPSDEQLETGIAGFDLGDLVAPQPTEELELASVHSLSIAEIIKSFVNERGPESILSTEQWNSLLHETGELPEGINLDEYELAAKEAEEIAASWKEQQAALREFQTGVAEMPQYKLTDMLRDIFLQPGLPLLEIAQGYFNKVSMPLAYSFYSLFSPDLKTLYAEAKAGGASDWQARATAWQEWGTPWGLKYMLLELPFDPLSYVGFGLFGRAAKSIPVLGKFLGPAVTKAELSVAKVFEAPFDFIKFIGAKIPKTVAQQASITASATSRMWRQYVSAGQNVFYQVTPAKLTEIGERVIKYTRTHPMADNATANLGRHLLSHEYMDTDLVTKWAKRLNSELTPEQVAHETVEAVDMFFEDWFSKGLTQGEAATRILAKLGVENTDEAMKMITKLMNAREAAILKKSLAFTNASTAVDGMKALARDKRALTIKNIKSQVFNERMRRGAIGQMTDRIENYVTSFWAEKLNFYFVRPFAEAYLTFAMYGPMNMLEDAIRSTLGGVRVGTVTRESLDRIAVGLSIDPVLFEMTMSESLGPMGRLGAEVTNNWVLNLGTLPLRPFIKEPAQKAFDLIVRRPGMFGSGTRAHFVVERYGQLLKEMGGEVVDKIVKAGPTKETLQIADKKIAKELFEELGKVKLSGNIEVIRDIKKLFTHRNITGREVRKVMAKYPDLPYAARESVWKAYDERRLFDNIEDIMKDCDDILMADFVKSPEYANVQIRQLADMLTSMEMRNPVEMAKAIQSIQVMADTMGALPHQIIGIATVRSRGLKAGQRQEAFDSVFAQIDDFLDQSGAQIQRVVEKLRATMATPESLNKLDWNLVKANPLARQYQPQIDKLFANMPISAKFRVKNIEVVRSKKITRSDGEVGIGEFDWYTQTLRVTEDALLGKTGDVLTLGHELGHSMVLERTVYQGDFTFIQDYMEKIGVDLTDDIVNSMRASKLNKATTAKMASMNLTTEQQSNFKALAGLQAASERTKAAGGIDFMDKFVEDFAKYSEGKLGNVRLQKWFEDFFPKTQRNLAFSPEYQDAASRLFDILVTRQSNSAQFRSENMALRQDIFAQTKAGKRNDEFWQDFGLNMDAEWQRFELMDAEIYGQQVRAAEALNNAQGIRTTRAPVVVSDRPLATQDIAKLLQVRGDDISRSLLQVLTINSKPRFVQYVMAKVVPGVDKGFTKEAVERVYDQIIASLKLSPETMSAISMGKAEITAMKQELHNLRLSKAISQEDINKIAKFIDDTADAVDNTMYQVGAKPGTRVLAPEYANYNELRQAAMDEAHKWYYKEFTDYTNANAFDALMKTIYPFWCTPTSTTILTKDGWKHHSDLKIGEDVLTLDYHTMTTNWEPVQDIAVFDYDDELMVIPAKGKDIEFTPNHRWIVVNSHNGSLPTTKRGYELTDGYDMIPRAVPHNFPSGSILTDCEAAILGWTCTDGYIRRSRDRKPELFIYQSIYKNIIDIEEATGTKAYPRSRANDNENMVIRVSQIDSDRILSICPSWDKLPQLIPQLSKSAAESMWLAMMQAEGNTFEAYNGNEFSSFKQNPGPVMQAFQMLSILLGKGITESQNGTCRRVNICNNTRIYGAKQVRRMKTKHYKGKVWCPVTPSGTWFMNCNGSILPTGNTYESQRLFWLPRSFIRHPGTFTEFERWQDNTDYGYVHIPGTSVDINPFRGTVYGTLTTRLTKRDYPEYYDALGPAGEMVQFMDFLSRWGFYPGVHISIPMSMFGGLESQGGEILPSLHKTPLNLLIAMFPDNESVTWLTEHVFSDRFRDYATILMVNRRGADGLRIWTKMQAGNELSQAEKDVWAEGRREAAIYGIGFEQFALFRLRTEEQYKAYEESAKVIETMTGISTADQEWLRMHGYRLWDILGGISPTQQQILEELDLYKWVGISRPLLPGHQQVVANKIDMFWEDVTNYNESQMQVRADLQRDFLAGRIGPTDYQDALSAVYAKQREYMDTLHATEAYSGVPLTLDERANYYAEFGVPVPVQHPMKELLNLYFSVELKQKIDEETGERVYDWDSFYVIKDVIAAAVPAEYKQEWDDYISRNSTPIEKLRHEINAQYFQPYNGIWDAVLKTYPEDQQRIINELLYLERTGQDLLRQAQIKSMVDAEGHSLVSGFRSKVSEAKQALRYANPTLDAWLFYWGNTRSFTSAESQAIYYQIAAQTGRKP